MSVHSRPDLASLVGDELSAICFVRDYVELHFDGPVLRLMGSVSLNRDDRDMKLGADDEFFGAIHKAIGRTLVAVGQSDKALSVTFDDRLRICSSAGTNGCEYALFVSFPEKRLFVWD